MCNSCRFLSQLYVINFKVDHKWVSINQNLTKKLFWCKKLKSTQISHSYSLCGLRKKTKTKTNVQIPQIFVPKINLLLNLISHKPLEMPASMLAERSWREPEWPLPLDSMLTGRRALQNFTENTVWKLCKISKILHQNKFIL